MIRFYLCICGLLLLSYSDSNSQTLRINEIQSSNAVFEDDDRDTPDWIELYNFGSETINLVGMSLTDDNAEPNKWVLGDDELAPDSYYLIWASDKDRPADHFRTLINQGDIFSYTLADVFTPNNWTSLSFDDSDWLQGASGFGYGDGDDATLIPSGTEAVFTRRTFEVTNPENIRALFLDIDYDDGFAAYINGVEIASANLNGRRYNATTNNDREATLYRDRPTVQYDLSEAIDLLLPGENVFSVQVHNINAQSSDLTLIPFLTALYTGESTDGVLPPALLGFPPSAPHTNFKISSSGEPIALYNPQGEQIDQIPAMEIPTDKSLGVSALQASKLVFFDQPTPGYANDSEEFTAVIDGSVSFSQPSSIISSGATVSLSGAATDEQIRYTLDGSRPTESSTIYQSPLTISNTTVVRAALFKPNHLPSSIASRSYLVNIEHDLPIVSLVADPFDFFDEEEGLYSYGNDYTNALPFFGANFWEDREKNISIDLLSSDGDQLYSFNAGVKIFGGWSRANDQKSLSLFARKRYGSEEIDYPIFDSTPYTTFQSLVLRNGGNDWLRSNMRDLVSSTLFEGSGLDLQAYQPVAAYLNGAYWGMYNIREKINEHYVASKHNLDPEDIDLLEFDGVVKAGDNTEYLALVDFVERNNLADPDNYQFVADQIDIDNFIMYNVAQIYIHNTDWPGNNIRWWRAEGRKWQWLLYDTDFGYGIWGDDNYLNNTMAFALEANGPDWPNPPWSTLLLRRLILNPTFKAEFVNRFADEMNTRFLTSNAIAAVNKVRDIIENEMPLHTTRWAGSMDYWNYDVLVIKNFFANRPLHMKNHLLSTLNLPAYHQLDLEIDDTAHGQVVINDRIHIDSKQWDGDYFQSVPVKLEAIPNSGYTFSHWSGDIDFITSEIAVNMLRPMTIVANFKSTTSTIDDNNPTDSFIIFPNPVANKLTLTNINPNNYLKIALLNQVGQHITQLYEGSNHGSQLTFDLSELKLDAGMYFLEITDGVKGLASKKLIKI